MRINKLIRDIIIIVTVMLVLSVWYARKDAHIDDSDVDSYNKCVKRYGYVGNHRNPEFPNHGRFCTTTDGRTFYDNN